jgi:MoxR-like ATPase/Mg-chelatase subunit ChlD
MIRVREEIIARMQQMGLEDFWERLLDGVYLAAEQKEALLTSLLTGRHILILGPPGCGKTALAQRLGNILDPIKVVQGCPLNCPPEAPSCPWCLEAKSWGASFRSRWLSAEERVKKVQGSGGLTPEDLVGDLDTEVASREGLHSPGAFIPGKLLRANRGILLIDFVDRAPERVLNVILTAVQDGAISIGAYDETIPLDILVVGTGSEQALHLLPLDLADCFDVVTLGYPSGTEAEKRIVRHHLGDKEGLLSDTEVSQVADIIAQTRTHAEVERGVSIRGAIKYAQMLASLHELGGDGGASEERWLRAAAHASLPHRLTLAPEVDLAGKREKIVDGIVDEVTQVEGKESELITLSKDDILALVGEIVRDEEFRQPLKYGDFSLLLTRMQRYPDSKLAQIVRQAMERLQELYPERYGTVDLTEDFLADLERRRKQQERISAVIQELEEEALAETLDLLEREDILERGKTGWEISQKGITFLLEKLTPRVWQSIYTYGYGKHSSGRKLSLGEGRVVGLRKYRFGDRYRDVSPRDTIREAIRNRRQELTREDLQIFIKDIRVRMDIVLALDLSGTMLQLDKLWYAKESAIALSLAAARSGDRVGVVSFSNLAEVVVDITTSPQKVASKVIGLQLHPNAFTNIGYSILTAVQLFARHRGGRASRHIILVSDGDATAPHPSPQRYALRQAAAAARQGITISCICINKESTDPELMRRISRIGKGRIYFVGPEGLTQALLEEKYATSFLH